MISPKPYEKIMEDNRKNSLKTQWVKQGENYCRRQESDGSIPCRRHVSKPGETAWSRSRALPGLRRTPDWMVVT